jgi:flavorubredoxin
MGLSLLNQRGRTMRICIIVHSAYGTTLRFANVISEKLQKDGHSVDLIALQTDVPVKTGTIRQPMNFQITNLPDISTYDTILAGGPVWAFSISTVIYKCLTTFSDMKGKKFLPFVTMGFPLPGMGGSGAMKIMSKVAKDLGADVLPGAVACKMFHNIDQMMEKEANKISEQLKTKN